MNLIRTGGGGLECSVSAKREGERMICGFDLHYGFGSVGDDRLRISERHQDRSPGPRTRERTAH